MKTIFTLFFMLLLGVLEAQTFTKQTGMPFIPVNYGAKKCAQFVDINNDGLLDVFFTGSTNIAGTGGNTSIYLNNGNNTFVTVPNLPFSGTFGQQGIWRDYNNDGYADLLLTSHASNPPAGGTWLYKNNGDSTFTQVLFIDRGGVVDWFDYNNDGKPDFILAEASYFSPPYYIKTYRNQGNDVFELDSNNIIFENNVSTPQDAYINCFDYNKDGYEDLIVYRSYNNVLTFKLYQNSGIGNFNPVPQFNIPAAYTTVFPFVDYNNDGFLDIFKGTGKVYLNNNGDGTFSEVVLNNVLDINGGYEWGDYNNDGRPDILISGNSPNLSKIYRNDSLNNFTDIGASITPISWWSTDKWGDYNNDGYLDFIVCGYSDYTGYKCAELYKSSGGSNPNSPPTSPTNLISFTSGNTVTLSWSGATDAQTNASALSYNVYIGSSPGTSDIVSSMSNIQTSFRRIPQIGNAGTNTNFIITGLPSGTYYWSVQAIDQAYAGGLFATEGSFTIGCQVPLPVAQDILSCSNGTATLTATGGTNYNWYNTATGGSIIGTGAIFITPYLTVTDTFWVSNFDSCESARVPVVVTILTGIAQNDTTICAGQSLTLNIEGAYDPLPTDGLVGYWPFNGNANDESGNGNNGTVNGAVLAIDRFGNSNSAYSFNGNGNYITVPNSPSLDITENITLSAWIYADNYNQCRDFISKTSPQIPDIEPFSLSGFSNGKVYLQTGSLVPDSTWGSYILSDISIPLNQWVLITGTVSGNDYRAYVNNLNAGISQSSIIDPFNGINNIPVKFGKFRNSGYFNGKLDDIRIYNRALSPSEITALYIEGTNSSIYSYLWSTGDTVASIIVSPAQTTTYYVTVTQGNAFCVDSVTVTVAPVGSAITGILTYDNASNTPLSCTMVFLVNNNGMDVDSTDTDLSGIFSFPNVPPGTYSLTASTTKAAGGINNVDALKALRHYVELETLTGLRFKAGDVNNSGYINTLDALLIQKRYLEMISTFPIGNWVFEEPTFTLSGSPMVVNFKGLCAGDVNGSYLPPDCTGQPCPNLPSFDYEGQTYNTVQIGEQCWMQQNLNIGTMVISTNTGSDHSDCSNNSIIEKYCYNNDPANCAVYGGLYDWNEMMGYTTTGGVQGICPSGWHIPTDAEWCALSTFLDHNADCNVWGWESHIAGGKLKEAGLTHWYSPTGATNESGFTALPGGNRYDYGNFHNIGYYGYWWSSSEYSTSSAVYRILNYGDAHVNRVSNSKTHGFSVRCLRDEGIGCTPMPTPSDAGPDQNVTGTSTNLSGNTPLNGTVLWSIVSGTGGSVADPGNPLSTFSGVAGNTYTLVYTITTICAASTDTVQITFSSPSFTCGLPFTDTRDGQVYNTVQIGTQCWMKENLNIGSWLANTGMPSNNGVVEKFCINSDPANCDIYGGLYLWDEMMNYSTASNQGICPAGWHIPTMPEMCNLFLYLDTTVNCNIIGLTGTNVGGKMKETGSIHWSPSFVNNGATNSSGFTAFGNGHIYKVNNGNYDFLTRGTFWTSTESTSAEAFDLILAVDYANIGIYNHEKLLHAFGVRCLKD